MTIRFYVPRRREIHEPLPAGIDDYWAWLSGHRGIAGGKYSWTLQTHFYLRQIGVPCELVRDLPRSGIVVAHRDFLPTTLLPTPDLYVVCIKPDRREHTWAHYYVVQNQNDRIFRTVGAGRAKALPYWPQPALVPRAARRGATCEHVGYYGRQVNLAEELKSPRWRAELRELGLEWRIVPHERWNDYGDCDVTVAVRAFTAQSDGNQVFDPNSKPPSKLVNSWLAGVPAVLGAESSFRDIRTSSLDFVEVSTLDELKAALVKLKSDSGLYAAMVEHGRARAREFSHDAVARQWRDLVQDEVGPGYERWMRKSAFVRQATNVKRTVAFFANRRNLLETRIHWGG